MLHSRTYPWVVGRAAGYLSRLADADRVSALMVDVSSWRRRIAEVQAAGLHFLLLPSREDLLELRRRAHRAQRSADALERELERLERLVRRRS